MIDADKETRVAVVVFVDVEGGADFMDRVHVAEITVRRALAGGETLKPFPLELEQVPYRTPPFGDEPKLMPPVRVHAIREIGIAARNGYVWVEATNHAYPGRRYPMSDEELTSAQVVGALRGTPGGKPTRVRISRPCYDKPHRCPGWAGGGCRAAKKDRCTEKGGYVRTRPRWVAPYTVGDTELGGYTVDHPGSNQWRFGRCDACGLCTWPYVVRWTSPRYLLTWKLAFWLRDVRYRIRSRGRW